MSTRSKRAAPGRQPKATAHQPRHVLLLNGPVPVLVVECAAGFSPRKEFVFKLQSLCRVQMPPTVGNCARGVSFDRLPALLRNGCDVEPVHAPLYATIYLDKVVEYGCEEDQVIQFFSQRHLDWTWREVGADIALGQLASLRKTFPTLLTRPDGSGYWLSRLPESDPRLASAYEREYGMWIPGDPMKALVAVAVLGEDFDGVLSRTRSVLQDYSSGHLPLA